MAFELYSGPDPHETIGVLAAAAMVKGGVCRFDAGTGYIEPAAAASATIYGICMETKTAGATSGADTVSVIPFVDGQVWKVDCTSTLVQTEVGTIVSLTNATSIDEDDTGNTPLFKIVGYVGALADKKALVRPMMANFTSVGV